MVIDVPHDSILVIGDLHFPYHHPNTFSFLKKCKDVLKPDLVISIGDETDGHGWSYHDKDPGLYSPGHEFREARTCLQTLYRIFPDMEILESNHGSLYWRKQKSHGLPKEFFKSYNEAWDIGPTWRWHIELTVLMSNNKYCYFHHGRSSDVLKTSQTRGMCAVQGHYHERMGVWHWCNTLDRYWAAQTGCLVDIQSLAMAYGKNNLKSPLMGSLWIKNGHAIPIELRTKKNGEWDGKVCGV